MMPETQLDHDDFPPPDAALSLEEYEDIHAEIEEQPKWRRTADKEMDYADGNQLDSELLRKQQELGIPPAIENLIGPSLLSIQGYETATRTDWRVTPSGSPGGNDVADALNFKLNQAERLARADKACSQAFRPQIGCGIGWVEVSRESDPFKYPYKALAIHRNEIHWDTKAREQDLSDARWLRRRRWLAPERVAQVFPEHRKAIAMSRGGNGPLWWADSSLSLDGGTSTDLQNAWNDGRAYTFLEDNWYNPTTKELCVAELWYRRWVSVPVLSAPNGRVVEYDEDNPHHNAILAKGLAKVSYATVTRVRRSYWLGPLRLFDGPSPYSHRHFPYIPFWGFREDTTGIPYGYVRDMKYPQDSLNSGNSKLRWGMSVTRTERTKGAVAMSDAQLRRQVARPDADIVLDAEHMAKQGARFEVKRDYQLTDQHHQMLQDNRATIERVSTVTAGFMGRQGTARSGLQEQTQVEQSNQSLGAIMDNFKIARAMVGELLLSMIVDDMGQDQHTVIIEGHGLKPDRSIVLNAPETDPSTGMHYLSNDLKRTRLQVELEEVPSSNSYRSQQLSAFSEAVKSLPPEYQAPVIPFLISLMDVPFKRDVIEAVRQVQDTPSPEDIEQMIQEALVNAGNDLKARELELKERKAESEIKNLDAKSVQVGVQAAFSAMQAGAQIAQMPMIAPVADAVMQGAGYQRPTPPGVDPNFPTAPEAAAMNIPNPYIQGEGTALRAEGEALPPVQQNTSPQFPPVAQEPDSGMNGIETSRITDNLP